MSFLGILQVYNWVRTKSWAEAFIACNRGHDNDIDGTEDAQKFWCFRVADFMYEMIKHKFYRNMYGGVENEHRLARQDKKEPCPCVKTCERRQYAHVHVKSSFHTPEFIGAPGLYYVDVNVMWGNTQEEVDRTVDNGEEHGMCIYITDPEMVFIFQGLGGHGPGNDYGMECITEGTEMDLSLLKEACPYHDSCYGCWTVGTSVQTLKKLLSGITLPIEEYGVFEFPANYIEQTMGNPKLVRLSITEAYYIYHK